MREEAVNVPEPEQKEALGRTERSDSQKGLPGRRLVDPGRSVNKRQDPTLSRHASKCRICNHPDRHAIEFDFLNWRNPADLARSYNLRDLTTIYRHAHATGLFAKRRLNLRFAMERIVERVNEVPVTANAVIRAARAIARINDSGEWVDPPSQLIVTHLDSDGAEGSAVLESSSTRRSHRHKDVGHSRATSHSSLATVFDPALLDEPSDSAANAGELPRINGKAAPTEVILQLTPEFARCREERWRGIEADRQARAAKNADSSSSSSLPQAAVNAPAAATQTPPRIEQKTHIDPQTEPPSPSSPPHAALDSKETSPDDALCGSGLQPRHNARLSGVSSPPHAALDSKETSPDDALCGSGLQPRHNARLSGVSSLPQAALDQSAPPLTAPSPAGESRGAIEGQSGAVSPSSLPQAAPDKPATACPELSRRSEAEGSPRRAEALSLPKGGAKQSPRLAGPPLGSSGSANPPFPFTPEPLRRWKPRRRF